MEAVRYRKLNLGPMKSDFFGSHLSSVLRPKGCCQAPQAIISESLVWLKSLTLPPIWAFLHPSLATIFGVWLLCDSKATMLPQGNLLSAIATVVWLLSLLSQELRKYPNSAARDPKMWWLLLLILQKEVCLAFPISHEDLSESSSSHFVQPSFWPRTSWGFAWVTKKTIGTGLSDHCGLIPSSTEAPYSLDKSSENPHTQTHARLPPRPPNRSRWQNLGSSLGPTSICISCTLNIF